jgi:predicted chitinase
MSKSKINIPKFSYPFKKVQSQEEYYDLLGKETHGNYLFSKNGFWHGGIHFSDTLTELSATEGIRAIADGQIVAFRVNSEYLQNDDEEKDNEGLYSNGFFLLKHYFEYPIGNKLTFFSLYMHTSKFSNYDFNTHIVIGENRFLRKGVSYAPEDKLEELDKNTKVTIGEELGGNRYKVLYVENTQRLDNATIHITNIKKIENKLELKCINRKIKTDEIVIPSSDIKVNAGDALGLVGEYNRSLQINRELLHLEVFTGDDVYSFASKAKAAYEADTSEDKPKPMKVIIEDGKDLYEKISECKLNKNSNIREGFSNTSAKYNNTTTPKDTILEVDLTTQQKVDQYTRVKVLKIDTTDVSSADYTVITDVLSDKKEIFKTLSEKSVKKELLSKDIKIEKDSTDEKYLLYSDDSNKYIKYSDCKESHPITFEWAKIIDESNEDDISIFTNLHKYLLPDVEDYKQEVLKVSSMYEKLFKEIDTNGNNQIEAQELEEATKNEAIKKITSKFIVKHSSEWDKKINMPNTIKQILEKHKENIKNYDKVKQHLENEEKRAENLALFEKCSSIADFPSSDEVFHINPIGLVGVFGSSGCYYNRDFTVDEVKAIVKALRESEKITSTSLWIPRYSSGISPTDKSYETTTKELNRVMNKYNINTCLRKIHFLAQCYHETDRFRAMTEYTSVYTARYDPYRGRGLVHLTHGETYKKFKDYMNDNEIYTNPSVIATNINYAFEAGGWYWENKGHVTATNENINFVADTDNTLKVSQCINGRVSNPNGLAERIKYVKELKRIFNYEKNI